MHFSRVISWNVLGASLLVGSALHGDVIVLSHGGRIEGTVLASPSGNRTTFLVQPQPGVKLVLSQDAVAEVIAPTDEQRWYEKWLPKMPATAEGNWRMAEECQKRGLLAERETHLQQVLQLDPDHAAARAALGFSRVEGKWVRLDDVMASRGFVRHQGKWRLPQEIALETEAGGFEQQVVEWRKKVRLWRTWLVRGKERTAEAEAQFLAIHDPAAVPVLAELLQDEKEPLPLKQLYVTVLGQLPNQAGASTLLKVAVDDADSRVRERALDQIERLQPRAATPALTQLLRSDKNVLVNRAASVLGRLKDPEATLPLIEALVTKHKQALPQGNQMNSSFDKNGSGSFSFGGGGGPKSVDVELKNASVLSALQAIHPGVNYNYSEEAWRRWYIDSVTPRETDLRRSP